MALIGLLWITKGSASMLAEGGHFGNGTMVAKGAPLASSFRTVNPKRGHRIPSWSHGVPHFRWEPKLPR